MGSTSGGRALAWVWVSAFVLGCAVLLGGGAARGQARARAPSAQPGDRVFEQEATQRNAALERELRALSEIAVEPFHRAGEATDARAGVADMDRVIALAPTFAPGFRRRCALRIELGEHAAAESDCERAMTLSPEDAENHAARARLWLRTSQHPEGRDLERASAAIEEAVRLAPRSVTIQVLRCSITVEKLEVGAGVAQMAECSRAMDRLAPASTAAALYGVLASLVAGEHGSATARLDRFEALSGSSTLTVELRNLIAKNTPWYVRAWRKTWPVLAVWLLLGLALFVAASALSKMTMLATSKPAVDDHPSASERRIRTVYRTVISLCALYFYGSIPVLLAGIVGIALGFGALILAMGAVPVKLVLIVGIVVLATLYAVVKSLFVRAKDEDPGPRLDLAAHPRLRSVLEEAAAQTKTRPVDVVFVVPDVEVAVFERGSMLKQLRGTAQRCLVLGAGVLDGVTVGELRAVLAHEYGHFRNEDTAGGGLALAVRRSTLAMAIEMAKHGVATWYNPAWWFVKGYYGLFLRVSHGASRLQEILADRVAAKAYGSQTFIDGLRKVVEQTVRFNVHVDDALGEIVPERKPLANLYQYVPATKTDGKVVLSEIEDALTREPTEYDSHPSPRDRFALVTALNFAPHASEGDEQGAWVLFEDRESIEAQMTAIVRNNVYRRTGVELPDGRAQASGAAEDAPESLSAP